MRRAVTSALGVCILAGGVAYGFNFRKVENIIEYIEQSITAQSDSFRILPLLWR